MALTIVQKVRSLQRLQQRLKAARTPRAFTDAAQLGLYEFIPRLNPVYGPPRHLDPLVQDLQRAWTEPVRSTGHAPPQHAKTDTILAFIALTLRKQPHRNIAYVTYESGLARSKSYKARQWAEAAGVQLAPGAKRLDEWRTKEGGGLMARGIRGPLTGQPVDILFVDDPYKDRVQAESPAYRRVVKDWWGDVAETRVRPSGSVFIFHTRWHTDDLIGHVLTGGDKAAWNHRLMPAVNKAGKPLWPEVYSRKVLDRKRASAGEYTWASLYQGEPRPRGGQLFQNAFTYATERRPKVGYRLAIGHDLAYSAKTQSDYSVAVVLAEVTERDEKGEDIQRYYVLEVVRDQVRASVFKETLRKLYARYPTAVHRFYGSGVELGTADLLEEDGIDLGAEAAVADKFIRAQPVSAAWNRGHVLVPESAPWVNDLVKEVTDFTGVKDLHDDQVDALAAAFDALAEPVADFDQEPGQYGTRRT